MCSLYDTEQLFSVRILDSEESIPFYESHIPLIK